MKLKLITLAGLLSFSILSNAQQHAQQHLSPCATGELHGNLVSLDNTFEQQGFKLVQFSTMTMPSGAILPISVKMEEGKMYQINFLAEKTFQQFTLRVLDKDRKKYIDLKVKQKEGASNRLSESFVAPYSGDFVILLTQKTKGGSDACGGFSVLKAVNDHLPATKKK